MLERGTPEYEIWAHAACLTIAEGSKERPPIELQSAAIQAVINVVDERDALKADNGWFIEAVEYIRTIALETRAGETFGGTREEHLLNQMSNIAQECLRITKMNHPGQRWLERYYELEKKVKSLENK
jgi:hypothetical protein